MDYSQLSFLTFSINYWYSSKLLCNNIAPGCPPLLFLFRAATMILMWNHDSVRTLILRGNKELYSTSRGHLSTVQIFERHFDSIPLSPFIYHISPSNCLCNSLLKAASESAYTLSCSVSKVIISCLFLISHIPSYFLCYCIWLKSETSAFCPFCRAPH